MNDQKENIAEVFRKHFNYYGFKKTSVDEVAKELHISKKTIYKFFSSKEKIFDYVVNKIAHQYIKKLEKELSEVPSTENKLFKLVELIFLDTRKRMKKEREAFQYKYKYEMTTVAFKDAYNAVLEKLIKEGIEKGSFQVNNINVSLSFINGIFSESMRMLGSYPYLEADDVYSSILKLLK